MTAFMESGEFFPDSKGRVVLESRFFSGFWSAGFWSVAFWREKRWS